jgi:anti-sigma factor RsiW
MSTVTTDELSAYIDGDLDDASRARVDAALAADPALRTELDELRAMIGDLAMPEIAAPAGLLGRVMADVADLPIPVAEGDHLASAAGPAVAVAAAAPERRDNVVRVSWWIKGPAASVLAALLVVGVGVWVFGNRTAGPPPAASSLVPAAPMAEAPVAAPAMTGATESGDALVAADDAEEVRERLRALAMAESAADGDLLEEPTGGVARGMLDPRGARHAEPTPAPSAPPPARARAAAEPPAEGVFVAEFERHDADAGDDGLEVAAVEELDPERKDGALGLEEVSFGAAPATAPRGGAATLTLGTGDRGAVVEALREHGWSVAPAGGGFQVTIPEGQEQTLVSVLRQHGQLAIESPMRPMRDGKSRLVVTFR